MKHKQQTTLAGCQWHAAYALLGDEELLEHVDDICPMRYLFKLVEKGYYPYCYFGNFYNHEATPPEFWERLAADTDETNYWVLTEYRMPTTEQHKVALIVSETAVWVSDSGFPDIQSFWLQDFLKSRYAEAIRVDVLYPMTPELYPPELVSQNPELVYNHRPL